MKRTRPKARRKTKGLMSKIIRNPIKSGLAGILAGGLATLVATTAIKDNVHFGSVTLYNSQESHYTLGLFPITKVVGDAKGDFYNLGLIGGANEFGDNSTLNGNASAYGIIGGANEFGDNSTLNGNASAYGIIGGFNEFGDNSTLNGDASAYGIISINYFGDNSKITGNLINKGILARNSVSGFGFGSNDVVGLENYVVSNEQTDGKREEK